MSWTTEFWRLVRDYRRYLWLLVMYQIFMLVLTGITLVFGETGTTAYTMALLNLILILGLGAVVVPIYWYSLQIHPERETLPNR